MLSIRKSDRYRVAGIVAMSVIAILAFSSSQSYCQIAKGQSKFIGNILGAYYIPSNFTKYWNQVTPENAGKWGNVAVSENPAKWNWTPLVKIYDYAIRHGFPFKYHNLIWGHQEPSWINKLKPEQQRKMVETWIKLAAEHCPKSAMIDVVNEPLQNPPSYKDALGGDGSTGWNWVIWSYKEARKYFPHTKLLLNDYNILKSRANTEKYITIIDLLKKRGLIDGIGVQGHFMEKVSPDTIKSNLKLLDATGLPVYLSEYDVSEASDSVQLAIYKQQFPIFWTDPSVKGITLWGYDGFTWRPNAFLITRNGRVRPALKWMIKYVKSHPETN